MSITLLKKFRIALLIIFLQILPLFTIITFGWLLTKFNVANQSWLKPIGDFAELSKLPAMYLLPNWSTFTALMEAW